MISPSTFYDLVSGRRCGPRAAFFRGVLRVAEVPYRTAVAWRNRRYDRGAAEVHRATVPVISVGNLTVGGTGKTPLVKWIARHLAERGLRVAILSRGYGAQEGSLNDEAAELKRDLPDVPHLQNPDRVALAHVAAREFDAQVILLDDGFQHRRLHRDLNIVLLDAMEPFGYGHLLPRGTLREPCSALARADIVVLSRANLVDRAARSEILTRVRHFAPEVRWCEIRHAPKAVVNAEGEARPWQELAGRRVAAFCGIGNPVGFRATLDAGGFEVAAWREFPDHHAYSRSDVTDLAAWCRHSGAAAALCTQKDLVKIPNVRLGGVPLWALVIDTEFIAGEDGMVRLLDKVCGRESL